jgi:hypothetical protein
MAAAITSITPGYARAGDSGISIVGTGFADSPALSEVYFRLVDDPPGAWQQVDPARVTYVSSTNLTIAIDALNTDGWEVGWQDIGVADFEDGTPDDSLEAALHFFGEDQMATITNVYPSYAKAGDATISIVGTGFVDDPSLTRVWIRETGETAWKEVAAARVTYVGATSLTIAIDALNTDVWVAGLNDVGVSDAGEATPDDDVEGALFFYVAGTFDPDAVIKGAPEAVYIEGLFMGHTHGGATIAHGVETSDIEVDQSLFPLRAIKSGETIEVTVPLAELTLENLKEIWGISASIEELGADRRRLTFGGDQDITEKTVMLVLPGPGGQEFALTLYRCAVTGPGDLSFTKGDQVDLPLQIKALADTSRAVGDQIGRWEEYTPA